MRKDGESRLLFVERTAPLFPAAVGLIGGIVIDRFSGLDPLAYLVCFILAGAALMSRAVRRCGRGVLVGLLAAGCVGGVLHFNAVRQVPSSSIERYLRDTDRIVRVRGTIALPPRLLKPPEHVFAPWTFGGYRAAFPLEVDSLEGVDGDIAVTGRIRVTVADPVLDLREGERVEVYGWLYRMWPPRNPGSFDWAGYSRRRGLVASLRCDHRQNVRRLDSASLPPRSGPVGWVRTTVRGLLTDDLVTGTAAETSLLEAMVLGHRSRLDRRLNEVFIQAGCIHFLAVSGVHVVIVMFFARAACRLLLCRRRTCIWAMIVTVVVYALVAEPRPPILRAGIIALIYCVACLLGRERACLNWISATAIVLTLYDPPVVFDIGFQLSFGAVLGVSYLTPAIAGWAAVTPPWIRRAVFKQCAVDEDLKAFVKQQSRNRKMRRVALAVWRRIAIALAVTVGAWLAAAPIVALCFQRIQPLGWLNSAIVFPLVSLVMGLGFAKLLVGVISPALGTLLAGPLIKADSLLLWIVQWLGSIPGSSLTAPQPTWWLVLLYYGFLGTLVWRFPRGGVARFYHDADSDNAGQRGGSNRDDVGKPIIDGLDSDDGRRVTSVEQGSLHRSANVACLVALAFLVVGATVWLWPRTPNRLVVTALAVGDGTATVIELPDGRTILYDAGSRNPYDVGHNTVVPFLRHRGIRSIDRVYVSHPNLDHFSGLPSIIEDVPTGPIVVNEHFLRLSEPRSPSTRLLEWLQERDHPLQVLDPSETTWEIGGVTFERLWPLGGADEALDSNDSSTVLRLSFAGHSILLTGDIEDYPQRALEERGGIEADVLMLPHHGSVRSSSRRFLLAVDPISVIQSSGRRPTGAPSGLTKIVGPVPLHNTARVGAVEVVVDSSGIRLTSVLPR